MSKAKITHSLELPRRAVIGGVLAFAMSGTARAACARPAVLFICPVGTVKSAIARETLKAQAAVAGRALDVRSRGIAVQNHVSPQLAAALESDRIDPAAEPPQKLATSDLWPGQIVIAFDEAAQDPRLAGARIWDVPSFNNSYAAAKAALSAHIAELVAELKDREDCG